MREQYRGKVKEAAERAVRGEVRELRKEIGRLLETEDKAAIAEALFRFYDPRSKNFKFMMNTLQPVMRDYGAKIAEAARAEYGEAQYGDLVDFIDNLLNRQGNINSQSSLKQLQRIVDVAGPGAVLEEVEKRMKEWVEGGPTGTTRGERFANRQVVQADGAIAREVWRRQGATKLIWRNSGSENCPICAQLNGKVIGIEESFVPAGMQIGVDGISEIDNEPQHGAHVPIKAGSDVMHPPLHAGCDCRIEVVT